MKNRAKCRLCNDIVEVSDRAESFFCKCGEIGIDAGRPYYKSDAKSWGNFLPLDEEGNEINVKSCNEEAKKDKGEVNPIKYTKPNRQQLLAMLDEMNNSFDNLPPHVQFGFITQCDLNAALLLIAQIFRVSRD